MRRLHLIAGAATLAICSPSFADHLGPGGVGSGGGLTIFSPDTLDAGNGVIGFRLVYNRPEQRSDAALEALAARGIHAHNTDYNLSATAGVAYGITHHLTVSAELPYMLRSDLREAESGNEVARLGTVLGIGDLSILAKYRLTGGSGASFALIGGIKTPTGSTQQPDLAGERLETEHQPGTGSWDPIIGASASTKAGAVQLTASALYQLSTIGAQRTRLGNRLQGGIAVSHRFGPQEQAHHHEADEAHHHHDGADERGHNSWDAFVEFAGEWEGRQIVDGEIEPESGGGWAYVAPGARFNSASGWSAAAAVAMPVAQDIRFSHPDNAYRLMLSLGRAL
jgi:hypothetical protein